MPDHTYPMLGAVKPHVRLAALEIGNKFDISTVYGIGARSGISDHPLGLALDFMVYKDITTGEQIADYVIQNWQRLSVKYILWQQRENDGGGWKAMEDRGSATANHKDHVHVSFEREPGSGGAYAGTPGSGDPLATAFLGAPLADALTAVDTQYPWNNWFTGANLVRVFGFILGVALLAVTIWRLLNA